MDISDTCCQEINTQICDSLALVRIRALASSDHAVFLSADGADLSLKRHIVLMCNLNKLCCLSYILIDRIV